MRDYFGWKPYVPVAERRRQALKKMDQLVKKGQDIQPIHIEGKKIARSFWGQAWCDHVESLGDYENRLPRGRTYVRNGSVCHLAISKGQIEAMVSGSEIYKLRVNIEVLAPAKWDRIRQRCGGHIGSLIELLQGKLSGQVMKVVTDPADGLFPRVNEIELKCNCPDWAGLCKHLAAVLYGIGARLDERPELLFLLRGVRHEDLVDARAEEAVALSSRSRRGRRTVAASDLSDVFGIDLNQEPSPPTNAHAPEKQQKKKVARKKKAKKAAKAAAPAGGETKKKKKVAKKKAVKRKKAVGAGRSSRERWVTIV